MPELKRLPTVEDGIDGLLDMAEKFGYPEFWHFVGMLTNDNRDLPAANIRTTIARILIEDELGGPADHEQAIPPGRPDMDDPYIVARQTVAEKLGIPPKNRQNFHKIVRGESRPRARG